MPCATCPAQARAFAINCATPRTVAMPLADLYTETMESTEKRLKPNIGISDFYKLRTKPRYYVDKTFLITRLLDNEAEVILFTRPRRFGKTLNMSMIQRFFDCNTDPGTKTTPADNRRLFDGLSICQDADAMEEQGKYPVIFMSLKDLTFTTWEEFSKRCANFLYKNFRKFKYLLDSDKITEDEKHDLTKLCTDNAELGIYSDALRLVPELLQKHHGVPAILLIDEYDAPIQGAYAQGYYNEMITFMRSFLGAGLKDNPALKFACLTGVMRVAKESIFSGLNNLTVDTVLSEDFSDCFGFTQKEVDDMAKYLGYEDKIPEIKAWYDGYLFGNQEIYNPWSVLNYFKNRGKAQAYWVSTSSKGVITEVLQKADITARKQLFELMDGKPVKAKMETSISYRDLNSSGNSIFSFLLMTGYLKTQEDLGFDDYLLQIPNREIRNIYPQEILDMISNELNFKGIGELFEYMMHGDALNFQTELNKYYSACVSFYDTGENFHQGFMLGLLGALAIYYDVRSNRETGNGRADIMLIPRDEARNNKKRNFPGIVLELKYDSFAKSATPASLPDDDNASLQALAQEALTQIAAKNYTAELTNAGVTPVLQYGLAFGHKATAVAMASITPPTCHGI